jgi:recombinase/recombinase-like zinc beta ribbon protein
LRTVAAILANPRYTGRQVWNRQFTDHREAIPGDRRSSIGPVRIWNPRSDWVISPSRTHPALVSDEDFTAAQQISARAMPEDGQHRRYALTGLLICGICERRMSGHWVNQRASYRCRHGHTSAQPAADETPRWLYWAETRLVEHLTAANTSLADTGSVDRLAAHLRNRDLVVLCDRNAVTITNVNEQPSNPLAASDRPDAAGTAALATQRPPAACSEQQMHAEHRGLSARPAPRKTRKSQRNHETHAIPPEM